MEILAVLALVALFSGSSSSSKTPAAGWSVSINNRAASIMRDATGWRWSTSTTSGVEPTLHGAIVAVGRAFEDFTSELQLRSGNGEFYGVITPSAAKNSDGLPLSFAWTLRVGTSPATAIDFFGDAQFRAIALSDMMQQLELEAPAIA